jgi:hypothetical protein
MHMFSTAGGVARDVGDGTMPRLTHKRTSLPPLHAEWAPAEVLQDLPMWEESCIHDLGKDSDSEERTKDQMTAVML